MEETSGEAIQREIPSPQTTGCAIGAAGGKTGKLQRFKT